jgi:hypothetical protein
MCSPLWRFGVSPRKNFRMHHPNLRLSARICGRTVVILSTFQMLVAALVLTRLDYANSQTLFYTPRLRRGSQNNWGAPAHGERMVVFLKIWGAGISPLPRGA